MTDFTKLSPYEINQLLQVFSKALATYEPPPTETKLYWQAYHSLEEGVDLTPQAERIKKIIDQLCEKYGYIYNPNKPPLNNRHFIALTMIDHPLEIAVKIKLIVKKPTAEEEARAMEIENLIKTYSGETHG